MLYHNFTILHNIIPKEKWVYTSVMFAQHAQRGTEQRSEGMEMVMQTIVYIYFIITLNLNSW